jgi:thiamine pyrophosphate-dependent acetolactate synthase large subunit-like protein
MFKGNALVPSICLATQGPGAVNLMNGLAAANQDRVPLIALTGQNASDYKRGFQNIDICGMMAQICKWSVSIDDPNNISEIVAMAFRQALTPPYGAVHIEFPTDIAGQLLTDPGAAEPLSVDLAWQFLAPNPSAVQKAFDLLTTQYQVLSLLPL